MRLIFAELGAPSIPSDHSLYQEYHEVFDEKGKLIDQRYDKRVVQFLEEFQWYVEALYNQIQYQLCKEGWIFTDKSGKTKDRKSILVQCVKQNPSIMDPDICNTSRDISDPIYVYRKKCFYTDMARQKINTSENEAKSV